VIQSHLKYGGNLNKLGGIIMTVDVNKLKGFVQEVVVGMQRRGDATSFIRDVLDEAKDQGFDKKQIRKLAKLALDRNAQEVKVEVNNLVDTYETLNL
jgi:uncharacterized protein (UPF0335 family)